MGPSDKGLGAIEPLRAEIELGLVEDLELLFPDRAEDVAGELLLVLGEVHLVPVEGDDSAGEAVGGVVSRSEGRVVQSALGILLLFDGTRPEEDGEAADLPSREHAGLDGVGKPHELLLEGIEIVAFDVDQEGIHQGEAVTELPPLMETLPKASEDDGVDGFGLFRPIEGEDVPVDALDVDRGKVAYGFLAAFIRHLLHFAQERAFGVDEGGLGEIRGGAKLLKLHLRAFEKQEESQGGRKHQQDEASKEEDPIHGLIRRGIDEQEAPVDA